MNCSECDWQQRTIELEEKVKNLEEELTKRNQIIQELWGKLRRYENPHTPPSKRFEKSEKEGDSRNSRGKKRPGRKGGHKGVTRPTPEPQERLDVTEETCPHCSSSLSDPVSVESKVVEDILPADRTIVREYRIGHYKCGTCGEEVIANHPDCPKEGSFGNNVLVQTTLLKYEERLPHRKVKAVLKRQYGLKLSGGTVLEITRRTASILRPEYDRILERIRNSKVVYIDETGMKVNGKNHWIWVFVTEDSVLFALRESRGAKVLREVLGDYHGHVVCDGWRAYASFSSKLQRCWSHLLREADDLKTEEGKKLAKQLHGMYKELTQFLKKGPPQEQRELKKEEAMKNMKELVKGWKCEKCVALTRKIENGMQYWFTFLTEEGVEPTNNRAERALRENVVIRKIIGTLRNGKGTYIHETIMSLLATWKERGLNPQDEMLKNLRS